MTIRVVLGRFSSTFRTCSARSCKLSMAGRKREHQSHPPAAPTASGAQGNQCPVLGKLGSQQSTSTGGDFAAGKASASEGPRTRETLPASPPRAWELWMSLMSLLQGPWHKGSFRPAQKGGCLKRRKCATLKLT